MEAPDKIYLIDFHSLGMSNHWYEKQQPVENLLIEGKNVEYINKDLLLEWANEKKAELLQDELTDVAAGINMGMDMLIYKLEQL